MGGPRDLENMAVRWLILVVAGIVDFLALDRMENGD